jgi:hypothetical protein
VYISGNTHVSAIFMRPFLTILITLTSICFAHGQTAKSILVRYDGLYQTVSDIDKEDNDTSYSFIRFYPDGTVITVASNGTVQDLKDWFRLKMDGASIGKYEIRKRKLYFSTTSKAGTVIYNGKILNPYILTIKWKSLINGNKGREKYYFIEVNDQK